MKTIFDDVDKRVELEEEKKGGSKYLPFTLWLVALVFLVGTWSVYRWVANHPAVEPPPPPISLEDVKQTSEVINRFNRFVQDDKWTDAEVMLSNAGRQRLQSQGKSLRESLLGERKDQKVLEAATTPSGEKTPDRVRQDCVYRFYDGQFIIVPLTLIIENEKIVVDSWVDETQKKEVESKK
ncbi:MAG: hypothetical protein AB7H86_07460 [Blastocatellales bacterium]